MLVESTPLPDVRELISRLLAAQIVNRTLIVDLMDELPHDKREQILDRLKAKAAHDQEPPIEGLDPQHLADEVARWI